MEEFKLILVPLCICASVVIPIWISHSQSTLVNRQSEMILLFPL